MVLVANYIFPAPAADCMAQIGQYLGVCLFGVM